jgi:hypothetical protein
MTPAIAIDARPGGPTAKRQPSPEGLGNQSVDDPSAVGAALNRCVIGSDPGYVIVDFQLPHNE